MATDYDTPRKTDDDVDSDSLEELKARRNDKTTSSVDVDEFEQAEGMLDHHRRKSLRCQVGGLGQAPR